MIYRTSTYYKIRKLQSKIKVIQGGQGAGKNIAIAQILLEDCARDRDITTIMSDTYDNLKDGAIADFKMLYEAAGLDWEGDYNKTDHDLKHQGGVIQFRYISDTKKQAGKSKRRGKLYLNECNKMGWEVASTYIGRTHGDVYLDYNPDYEFWAHTEIPKLRDAEDNPLGEQIVVTYIDNEMCPQSEVDYILSRKDNVEWFRVYGLGQTGYFSERRIYKYQIVQEIPAMAYRISSGMDFGVSPDPTVLIDVWRRDNRLYVDEVFCMNNLMPEKIRGAERMSIVDQLAFVNHPKGQPIIADSAGATEIRDMMRHGYNVRGVKKGPNSVIDGISKLRGYDIYITERSVNIKKGAESFFWKVDKNGKIIPEPDGHEPDGWAALRYVNMMHDRGSAMTRKN